MNDTTSPLPSPPPDSTGRAVDAPMLPRRRSRWLKRVGIALLMITAFVALLGWTVTRSWFIVWQLTPVLERKLGGEVEILRATYLGGGRMAFDGIAVRARELSGPAAEIARIDRLLVDVDVSAILGGQLKIEDAQMSGVTVRISEDALQTGRMNFMSLQPSSGGGGDRNLPVRIRIDSLTLEVGVHMNNHFLLNGQRRMAGEMHPVDGQSDWFAFELAEVDDFGKALGQEGLFVKGEWNVLTTEAHTRIEAIALDDRVRMMLPQQARHWWNRMALAGVVDGVMIDWHPEHPLTVRFGMKDIAMTLPVDLGEVWSVYRDGQVEATTSRPRMNLHSGVIRVATDSLMLDDLRGELISAEVEADESEAPPAHPLDMVGVPYEISLHVPRLPAIDLTNPERWMEEALRTSAFVLTARLDNFSLAKTEQGTAQAVGLPSIVARVLAKFQTTGWVLSTSVRVSRADPDIDDGGMRRAAPLRVSGQAYIHDATGSYHKFPYRMEDVDAYLHFTDERVVVEYLQARGAGDSTFRVSGYIEPPDNDASFHLDVTGFNVPLDDRFRDALKDKERQAVDALFHTESAERLARAGLLPDAQLLEQQAKQRDALRVEAARIRSSSDPDVIALESIERRILAFDRSISAGPFVAGGTVNLNLTLDRPLGKHQATLVQGIIDVRNAGLVFDRFPYPLRGSGRLRWEPDRIVIDDDSIKDDDPKTQRGIRFVTPAGGEGRVSGVVAFPKNESGNRSIKPDLHFTIRDDPSNDAVYAAIPFGKQELQLTPKLEHDWPGMLLSKSGAIVKGIGLDGLFDYMGVIGTRDDGKINWDFRVNLDDGTAQPNELLATSINARDLPWPADLLLQELRGEVRITRDDVSWKNITGVSASTRVTASGLIDFRNSDAGGGGDYSSVKLDNAPIDRSALNMIGAAYAETADVLWDRYQPSGWIDGEILWRSQAQPGEAGTFIFHPRDISILLGDQRVKMHGAAVDDDQSINAGMVHIDGNQMRLNMIALELVNQPHGEQAHVENSGRLTVYGHWMFAGPSPKYDIAGTWTSGRFDSPVIPEALRVFGQTENAARYDSLKPSGVLNLTYEIARDAPDAPARYRFDVEPESIDFLLRDTLISMDIESGRASITPGLIALDAITGHSTNGVFGLSGQIDTLDRIDASLLINYAGELRSEEVAAFLPVVVNDSIAALAFDDSTSGDTNAASRVRDASLRMKQSPHAGNDDASTGWAVDFSGVIETRGATFVAGVPFTEVDATFDLDVSYEPGNPLKLHASGRASNAVVLGQRLYDIDAPIALNAAGDAVEIGAARARSGHGAVAASVISGIGDRLDYQLRVDLVGTPLGDMFIDPTASTAGAPADVLTTSSRAGVTADGFRDDVLLHSERVADQRPQRTQSTLTPHQAASVSPSGEVYASVTIAGDRLAASSKRGRGVIRVINGRLSAIPLALQAMNMLQLTLPLAGELDYADAEMYVIGDLVHFEHILFESSVGNAATLQLRGEGTLDLRTMNIAARFRPRSGIAILRDIIGGIGDMLYEIELTGPLRQPKARIVPLPR